MTRKIVLTSGKGGVGKTTITANLGVQLAKSGKKVLVCDLDFGLNNIDVVLGMENMALFDMIDVVEGKCRARQALVRHPKFPLLYCITSNQISDRYISPQAVRLVLEAVSQQFDYLLIDSPAGIDEGFHRAVSCADEAILVTTLHISAVRDANRVYGMLKDYRMREINLVVNMVKRDLLRRGELLTPTEISNKLHIPLAGIIPEENKIFTENIASHSKTFKKLADFYKKASDTNAQRGIL